MKTKSLDRSEMPFTGEVWKTKDGRKFTILDVNAGSKYPVQAVDEKRRFVMFTRIGNFVDDSFPHDNDLITRV
jgi:hypothetical protein